MESVGFKESIVFRVVFWVLLEARKEPRITNFPNPCGGTAA